MANSRSSGYRSQPVSDAQRTAVLHRALNSGRRVQITRGQGRAIRSATTGRFVVRRAN